ncbi:Serine/threonine-protein phosphatase 7 long form homolog [Linum grandiflorum]
MELCTALIDRWRPETNTFHMYHGEMTITLEDVAFITGLPVDGGAVFQEYPPRDYDWDAAIFRILGARQERLREGRAIEVDMVEEYVRQAQPDLLY